MTFNERVQAERMAERAGFPVVGTPYIEAEDDEVYALQIQDVDAGRTITFLHLLSVERYIKAALAESSALIPVLAA